MEFKKTIYSVQDGIAVITMNYMKNLNAIDEQMADELLELFARAEADEAVKVVVLKGADKAFSAGGDIGFFYQQVQAGGDVSLDDLIARVGKLADYMKKMSKMIITAVSGASAGAGVPIREQLTSLQRASGQQEPWNCLPPAALWALLRPKNWAWPIRS